MVRIAAIVLVLGMCMPETLLAWVTFETGEIDSSTVKPGAYVEIIYGKGEQDPVSGKWEKLDPVKGYIQAIDAERLIIGERFWKKEIELERIKKLTIATSDKVEKRRSPTEIGAELLSVQFVTGPYASTTLINLGGGLSRSSPSIYISSFSFNRLALDLGLGLTAWSHDGGNNTSWMARGGFTYLPQGTTSNALYIRSFAAVLDRGSSASQFGAGGGLGYRHVFHNRIAMRLETSYMRWFKAKENRITVRLSFGVVLGGKGAFPESE